MISLDDPIWKTLNGGYRIPFDPRPAMSKIEGNEDIESSWYQLFDGLHHQGNVDLASYASVPILVDMFRQNDRVDADFYMLVATIELERNDGNNPPVPDWLAGDYEQAWVDLQLLAARQISRAGDLWEIRSILAVLAIAKGDRELGRHILFLQDSEPDELLRDFYSNAP